MQRLLLKEIPYRPVPSCHTFAESRKPLSPQNPKSSGGSVGILVPGVGSVWGLEVGLRVWSTKLGIAAEKTYLP